MSAVRLDAPRDHLIGLAAVWPAAAGVVIISKIIALHKVRRFVTLFAVSVGLCGRSVLSSHFTFGYERIYLAFVEGVTLRSPAVPDSFTQN